MAVCCHSPVRGIDAMTALFRLIIFLPLLLVTLAGGGIYATYGQIEPCRVLAAERAMRADLPIPFGESAAEAYERIQVSQMSGKDCARDLLDSWGERLAKAWK